MVMISGHLGIRPGGTLAEGGFAAQACRAFETVAAPPASTAVQIPRLFREDDLVDSIVVVSEPEAGTARRLPPHPALPHTRPMILHIHPGTSGLAPHMALLATGAPFTLQTLDLFKGEHRTEAFAAKNPFQTVPVLEDGDTLVAETGAILLHLAERFPAAHLLPQDATRPLALAWLFRAAAIHADFMTWRRAYLRAKTEPAGMDETQAWMQARLATAFRVTDGALAGQHLAGDTPTIADLYLLMVANWERRFFGFATETPRLAASLHALSQRPYVIAAYEAQNQKPPAFA